MRILYRTPDRAILALGVLVQNILFLCPNPRKVVVFRGVLLTLLLAWALGLPLAALARPSSKAKPARPTPGLSLIDPTRLELAAQIAVQAFLDRMDDRALCGQALMIDVVGTSLTPAMGELLDAVKPGGILLFDYNIRNPESLAELTRSIRHWAASNGHSSPVFAVDQEGGPISRLSPSRGFTAFPSPMAMAATGDDALFTATCAAMAREMKSVGIDLDLAPVLDVVDGRSSAVIGIRSFGGSPQAVARWGERWVRCMAAEGVASAAKHFPGHGLAGGDSHLELPIVDAGRADLITRDLLPFLAAMRSGCTAFLSAHVVFPAFEPDWALPATLSSPVLRGLLRSQMSFPGLLITDSMVMGAITNHRRPAQAAREALLAGADFILVPDGPDEIRRLHEELVEMLRAELSLRKRFEEAAARILAWKWKQRRGSALEPPFSTNDWQTHAALAEAVSRRAIAAAATNALALRESSLFIELPWAWGKEAIPGSMRRVISASPGPTELQALMAEARTAPSTCIIFRKVDGYAWIEPVVRAVAAAQPQLVLVRTGNPWDLDGLECGASLYTFGWNPWTGDELGRILRGESRPKGVLPFPTVPPAVVRGAH